MKRPHPEASPGCRRPVEVESRTAVRYGNPHELIRAPDLELDLRGAGVPEAVRDQFRHEEPDVLGKFGIERAVEGAQSVPSRARSLAVSFEAAAQEMVEFW